MWLWVGGTPPKKKWQRWVNIKDLYLKENNMSEMNMCTTLVNVVQSISKNISPTIFWWFKMKDAYSSYTTTKTEYHFQ